MKSERRGALDPGLRRHLRSGDHDVWAVGPISAIHWNGKAWARVPTGSFGPSVVADIAKTDTWLFGVAGNKSRAEFAHWNGKAFSTSAALDQGKYQPQVLALYAAGSGDVWAAGASGQDPLRPPFYPPTNVSVSTSISKEKWNFVVIGRGFVVAGSEPGSGERYSRSPTYGLTIPTSFERRGLLSAVTGAVRMAPRLLLVLTAT